MNLSHTLEPPIAGTAGRGKIAPGSILLFINLCAWGSIAPLLFYVISLPDSIWIGLLFCTGSIGRLIGPLLLKSIQKRRGDRTALLLGQAITVLAYVLLSTAGHYPQVPALGMIYVCCFMLAGLAPRSASAWYVSGEASPSVPLMLGFTAGCLLAMVGNNHRIPGSIQMLDGLHRPALQAAALSAIAWMIAWSVNPESIPFPEIREAENSSWPTWMIASACEIGFGMTLCVLPLMAWETFAFRPARLGLYLAMMTLLSCGSSIALRRLIARRNLSPLVWIAAGCLIGAVGFAGFFSSLAVSWLTHPVDGMRVGVWVLWISAIPAAIAHGMLRESFQFSEPIADRTAAISTGFFRPAMIILSGAAALFASSIWAMHDRGSLAIPALIVGLALPVAVYQIRLSRHPADAPR